MLLEWALIHVMFQGINVIGSDSDGDPIFDCEKNVSNLFLISIIKYLNTYKNFLIKKEVRKLCTLRCEIDGEYGIEKKRETY